MTTYLLSYRTIFSLHVFLSGLPHTHTNVALSLTPALFPHTSSFPHSRAIRVSPGPAVRRERERERAQLAVAEVCREQQGDVCVETCALVVYMKAVRAICEVIMVVPSQHVRNDYPMLYFFFVN